MSLYDENIEIVIKKCPHLKCLKAKNTHLLKGTDDLAFFFTPSGAPSGKYKNIYIHSRFDPVKEAKRMIGENCNDEISTCVFYGFGMGYHIESFISEFPETHILVIEPDLEFFLKSLYSRSMKSLLSNPFLNLS